MRVTIDSQQRAFFRLNHYIEFEQIITAEECMQLFEEIQKKIKNFPKPEDLDFLSFNSLPLLLSLIRRRQLAELAFEFMDKKPLRLKSSSLVSSPPTQSEPLDEEECGLFLSLNGEKQGNAIYYLEHLPTTLDLYNHANPCYLLLIFTSKYLRDEYHPIVLR